MTAKKAPCIDVRTDVHKDERFAMLGDLAGYNRYEAIGRMHALWSWCRDRGLQDTIDDVDGYAVSEPVVRRFLGPDGVAAILADGCDELALAVRIAGGLLYLRGTSEYVAAARAHAITSRAGGRARAEAGRDQSGRYVGSTTDVQPGSHPKATQTPPAKPAEAHPSPASSLFPLPSCQSQNTHTPRAIPPVQGSTWKRHESWWLFMLAAHGRLRAKGIVKPNEPELAKHPHEQWLSGCERYLRDGGYDEASVDAKMRHVVLVYEAEAETLGHPKFFKPAIIWDATRPDRFPRKVDTTIEEARATRGGRPARAGPRRAGESIGAAAPRSDHPDSPTLKSFGEL